MLHKNKITLYAFVLFLFGFILMTLSSISQVQATGVGDELTINGSRYWTGEYTKKRVEEMMTNTGGPSQKQQENEKKWINEVANRIIALEKQKDLLYAGEKDDTLSFSTMVAQSPEVELIVEQMKTMGKGLYEKFKSEEDIITQLEKRITELEGKLKVLECELKKCG